MHACAARNHRSRDHVWGCGGPLGDVLCPRLETWRLVINGSFRCYGDVLELFALCVSSLQAPGSVVGGCGRPMRFVRLHFEMLGD